MRDIGKNIRQLRTEKGLTQDELAEKLFVTRQTVSNYETGRTRPDIDMLLKISEVLGIGVEQLVYGRRPEPVNRQMRQLIISAAVTSLLGMLLALLKPEAAELAKRYSGAPLMAAELLLGALCMLAMGWTTAQLLGLALRPKLPTPPWRKRAGQVLLALMAVWFVLVCWNVIATAVNDWQFHNHIRGEWTEVEMLRGDGTRETGKGWSKLEPQLPRWVGILTVLPLTGRGSFALYLLLMLLLGAALWYWKCPENGDSSV